MHQPQTTMGGVRVKSMWMASLNPMGLLVWSAVNKWTSEGTVYSHNDKNQNAPITNNHGATCDNTQPVNTIVLMKTSSMAVKTSWSTSKWLIIL